MVAGTLLAVISSTLLTLGLYLMKRQAERLPSLAWGWRLAAWAAFLRDPVWLGGVALQIVGYGLYFVALHSAPLSVVHTALNGGIGLFVICAVVGLGEEPRPAEWLGVALVTASLIALSASLSSGPVAQGAPHDVAFFSLVMLALAALAWLADRQPHRTVSLSVASGLLLGLASVYAKGLADAASLTSPGAVVYVLLTAGANLVGFALMQAALQAGRGVVAMPLFSALSNLVPIMGGILVFGEAVPSGAPHVLRPLAVALTLVGGALLAGFGDRGAPSRIPQAERASSR